MRSFFAIYTEAKSYERSKVMSAQEVANDYQKVEEQRKRVLNASDNYNQTRTTYRTDRADA